MILAQIVFIYAFIILINYNKGFIYRHLSYTYIILLHKLFILF